MSPLNKVQYKAMSTLDLVPVLPADAATTQLLKAAHYAAVKHRAQRRKDADATPYINHPLGVAMLLASEGGVTDVDVLMAAVLHDTVEDTDATLDEVERVFGARVAGLVAEVTDDKSLSKGSFAFSGWEAKDAGD